MNCSGFAIIHTPFPPSSWGVPLPLSTWSNRVRSSRRLWTSVLTHPTRGGHSLSVSQLLSQTKNQDDYNMKKKRRV